MKGAKVISGADILGTSIPIEMLPDEIKDEFYKDGMTATLLDTRDLSNIFKYQMEK